MQDLVGCLARLGTVSGTSVWSIQYGLRDPLCRVDCTREKGAAVRGTPGRESERIVWDFWGGGAGGGSRMEKLVMYYVCCYCNEGSVFLSYPIPFSITVYCVCGCSFLSTLFYISLRSTYIY